jgi:hypothetical protein
MQNQNVTLDQKASTSHRVKVFPEKSGINMKDEALPRSGQNDGDTNIASPALSRIKYWRLRALVIVPAPRNSDAWEFMVVISM